MFAITLLAALFLGQPSDDATIAWKVPTEAVSLCCCEGRGYRESDDRETTEVLLVARLERGTIREVKLRDAVCPIGKAKLVEGVSVDASLDALSGQIERQGGAEEDIVSAIAIHDSPRVAPMLLELARRHPAGGVRKTAVFWLGQKAGARAAADLRAIVDDDPEDEVRQSAVFAISQLPRERSVPMLADLVKTHRRPAVRERAMFWLAQSGDPRALDLIAEILGVE